MSSQVNGTAKGIPAQEVPVSMKIKTWLLSIIYGLFVSCYLIFSIIRNRSKFFQHKRRDVPPKCLYDPSHGTHHFIQLKDIKMHYVSKGDENNQTMLFIHGCPELWYSWRNQMEEFAKDYHVIAVDNRGYGDTEKPSGAHNYTLDLIVEDTRQLLEALNKTKIVIVSHDFGGAIGWRFVAKYPEMVDKNIIINSPHPLMTRSAGWKQLWYSWYMSFYNLPYLPEFAMQSNDYYLFDYVMRTWDEKPLLSAEHMEAYKYQFQKHGFTGPLNWYRAVVRRYPLQHPKSYQIKTPTLTIWGTGDKYLTTPLAAAHKYVDDLEVKYIDKCSHWTQMERPVLVNKYMREWLESRKK
ncbi:unnamed protein product [Oppiella nova]|uniref:AB hydrolase-1 domain-containing protein n=1 Tax=Oppiella nova TaxID=334625 RepID=A0A7R9L9A4_9ACAR|nr:unnamed protein product [Oppiella nova]CAG2160481.1 unnamed protein product [Oppiella nova]